MEIGKVPNSILKSIILDRLKTNRKEILLRPKIGEDCCAVDFDKYACVLTTDPITGAVHEIGRLAVHISCNDIASSGVEPLGMLVTIMAPPSSTTQELEIIMTQLIDTANSLNVDIIGGHTEVTRAVTRYVIVGTAIGRILKEKLVTTSGARPGDHIVITKSAGIEGTSIIAHDKEELLLQKFDKQFVEKAKGYINSVSVVKEGIIAGEHGVSAMHDVTEGGVLGAVWEVAEASDVGFKVYKDSIPIEHETQLICDLFNIDPLRLISSGCMVITCNNGEELVSKLSENGVKAAVIGEITHELKRTLTYENGIVEEIDQPVADELYKVIV